MKVILSKTLKDSYGIYQIRNLVNNKIYIGSTIQGFKKRLYNHLYELRRNTHYSSYLQRAWNKYGEESFEFTILEVCDKSVIIQREQYWLDELQPYKRNVGYNLLINARNSQGYKHTEESLILIGQKSKLRDTTKAVRAMQTANIGRRRDEAHSIRMSRVHSKAVIQLSLTGEFIREWISITEANKSFKLKQSDSNISKCCNGKCKSYQGFMWVKKSEYNPNKTYTYSPIINGKQI